MLFSPRMEKDNRVHPRYEVDAQVDLLASGASSTSPIQNLSLGGICLRSTLVEEVGSPVDVVVRMPELGLEVALHGEVVWVNRSPPQDVGIRWVALDEERRAVLSRYLDLVTRAV